MSYPHQQIDERLQRERADRIYREFATYDSPDDSLGEVLDSMTLPKGKTCSDCRNWQFCSWFLAASIKPTNTICDWSPSKFVEVEAQERARAMDNSPLFTGAGGNKAEKSYKGIKI